MTSRRLTKELSRHWQYRFLGGLVAQVRRRHLAISLAGKVTIRESSANKPYPLRQATLPLSMRVQGPVLNCLDKSSASKPNREEGREKVARRRRGVFAIRHKRGDNA